MATFNGGRMVALFLCVLFALNASFAQDTAGEYVTHILYMEDPVDEGVASEVDAYGARWNDPLTWVDFDAHFTPARQAQADRIEAENAIRVEHAEEILGRSTNYTTGEGVDAWVPSAFPLVRFRSAEDSLFSSIIRRDLPASLRGVEGQTLREFIRADGWEPDPKSDGVRDCDEGPRCAQLKRTYSFIESLIDKYDNGTRIVSVRFKARSNTTDARPDTLITSYRDELIGITSTGGGGRETEFTEVLEGSVELLRPAAMGTDEWRIDVPPYDKYPPYLSIAHIDTTQATPVGKLNASAEASSWGRIKATFADD